MIIKLNKNNIYKVISNKIDGSWLHNKSGKKLNSYLVGLIEGDGHIYVSKKKLNGYIAITLHKKELPLVKKLKELIGGSIRIKDKENAIVLTIAAKKHLINLTELINGYFRTPKINEFNLLIEYLNKKYNTQIIEKPIDTSDLLNNGWLAGFLDADSSFQIRYTEELRSLISNKIIRKGRIEVRMTLEQRKYHTKTNMEYKKIMKSICNFFNLSIENEVNLRTSYHNNKEYWIIVISSINKLGILINYLGKYNLLTSKNNDYKDWLLVYKMIKNKEHLTINGKKIIKEIKENMNKKRTKFN